MNKNFEEHVGRLKGEHASFFANHNNEKAELKQEALQLEEQIKNLTTHASNVDGDILFFGSWVQVPKGWHGRLALDLRPLRNIWELSFSGMFDWDKVVMRVPK